MYKVKLLATPLILLSCITFSDEFLDDLASEKDHRGWYVGGRVGQISTEFETDYSSFSPRKNDSGIGGVYFGYNFTNWFGLEADFG